MAVGKEEKVFTGTLHVKAFVVLHFQNKGQRRTRYIPGSHQVPRLAGVHHAYDVPPDLGGELLKGSKIGHLKVVKSRRCANFINPAKQLAGNAAMGAN